VSNKQKKYMKNLIFRFILNFFRISNPKNPDP
jgi:hypothetical protein